MCYIYDINVERGTTVRGPPVNIIVPSDPRYASRINDRYKRRIFFYIFASRQRREDKCKIQQGDFNNLHCPNIPRQNNNFINLANKYNNKPQRRL